MSTDEKYHTGVVYRKSIGQYTVHSGSQEYACVLSSRLRKELIYPTADPASCAHIVRGVRLVEGNDPLAIGDEVSFFETGNGRGMVTTVLPRRTVFSRQASTAGKHASEQVIAANTDQVVAVFSAASPPPNWSLLDRILVSAEASGLKVLICITKIDLASANDCMEESLQVYRRIGYPVCQVSALTGRGLSDLQQALNDRLSVLVGKSGVGKSTLLNALQPGLGIRVHAVSSGKLGKGLHTTTHQEIFQLDSGALVVDSPGLRTFALWDIQPQDLAACFPEMRPYLGGCKFGLSCRHDSETGCAIRIAVMTGKVHPLRYRSLLRLQEEP